MSAAGHTDSARIGETELAIYFTKYEMQQLRHNAEAIRRNRRGASWLGANHYFEAVVRLGWPHKLAERMWWRRRGA